MSLPILPSQQLGLSFHDPVVSDVGSEVSSAWSPPKHSTPQYRERMQHIAGMIDHIEHPLLRAMVSEGVTLAQEQIESLAETTEDDEVSPYLLPMRELNIDAKQFEAFVKLCVPADYPNAEVRVRQQYWHLGVGITSPDMGSLIAQSWRNGGHRIVFALTRQPFFNPSFLDDAPRFELAAKFWEPFAASQRISLAGKIPAAVPSFKYNGQFHVQLSSTYYGDGFRECEGWTLLPAEDWGSATYTYRELCKEWNNGRIERGNVRGLMVNVNQCLCVLNTCVVFFDPTDVKQEETEGAPTAEMSTHTGE